MNTRGSIVDPTLLNGMMDVIRHRGPDGEGTYLAPNVALGHRRLSIIDVAGGTQPIANEDGSIQVVFNGEIYNFIELRQELQALGHRFITHSDTEVIVHAYEEWGTDCVSRFNGMFAFAIWDTRAQELFIARDHLGVKPLYYAFVDNQLVFGSEIKSLLKHPACRPALDESALAELFTFRFVPSPKTLFQGIAKLPPAHWLIASRQGIRVSRYWNWVPVNSTTKNENELIEEYQFLLEDAVRLQLRSDVPLGLFLSSGVDSSALLAIMSRSSKGPVQAYTIGFENGEETNEIADAQQIARMFGADHHYQILGPDDYVAYFQRYMRDLEEPVGHEAAPAFHFVSQNASRGVKVALTGQGADEPWAGYDRYKGARLSSFYSRLPSRLTRVFARTINSIPGRMERLKRGASSLGEPDMLTRLAKVYSFFSADMKSKLYGEVLQKDFQRDPYATRHALSRLQLDVSKLDALSQMLYIDTRASLPDDLLMVGDKTSMANSLEARVPFLDYRLVEFIENLPPRLKLRGFTGKYLHKKACLKWLPREIVYRKKKGFANPIEKWFREKMKPFVDDCLLSSDSSMKTYFDQKYISHILDQDRSGKEQYRRHIYLLVSLELWHRTFLRQ